MDGRTDGRTGRADGWTGQTDGWTDGRTDGWTPILNRRQNLLPSACLRCALVTLCICCRYSALSSRSARSGRRLCVGSEARPRLLSSRAASRPCLLRVVRSSPGSTLLGVGSVVCGRSLLGRALYCYCRTVKEGETVGCNFLLCFASCSACWHCMGSFSYFSALFVLLLLLLLLASCHCFFFLPRSFSPRLVTRTPIFGAPIASRIPIWLSCCLRS